MTPTLPPPFQSAFNVKYPLCYRNNIPVRWNAFTLLELLAAIAILATLAGILFPVFARSREAGRATSCLAHERQIGIAVLGYTQDWDGMFPQLHPMPSSGPVLTGSPPEASLELLGSWRIMLASYVRSQELFECPSDIGFGQSHPSSYAPNGYLGYGASLTDVSASADTILLVELAGGSLSEDISPWLGEKTLRGDIAGTRHNATANYVFVDGHIRGLPFDRTWFPVNHYLLSP